jgi:hypothetical protein
VNLHTAYIADDKKPKAEIKTKAAAKKVKTKK